MKNFTYKHIIVILCLVFNLLLISSAFAEEKNVQNYDTGVITGFESEAYKYVVNTDYKYALIELEKEFPSQLTVRLGGKATYQKNQEGSDILTSVENYQTRNLDAAWVCKENYDEDLKTFHFVPDLKNYKLAAGLEVPVLTVNVLGELPIPPLNPIIEEEHRPFTMKEDSSGTGGIPSYYNNYQSGKLPPIRNQNPYGTCWAFSNLAAVEADLIHDGKATTSIDLSELHLAYFTYHKFYDEKGLNTFDNISNVPSGNGYLELGGNSFITANTLVNMLGPVKESSAPYTSASTYSPSASSGRTGDYHVTGSYYYDIKDNRDSVKNAIMNHGAVSIAFNANSSFWSPTYNSYYCPSSVSTNHLVAVVGWDDNFSRNNFRLGTPAGDGAWLIRNSWGVNGYNYSGYFWMSYYDKSLYRYAYAYDAMPGRYDHVYSYDNAPNYSWTEYYLDYSQSFYVDGGEEIRAISFRTEESNLDIKFTISSENTSVTQNLKTTAPGYYLIPLTKTLKIQNNSRVNVSYSYNDNNTHYVFYEAGTYYMTYNNNRIEFRSGPDSEGFVIAGGIRKYYDGKIKLFTNDISGSVPVLEIKDSNIRGKNKEIQIVIPWSSDLKQVECTLYNDQTGQKVNMTMKERMDSTGKNKVISYVGSPLENGTVYRFKVRVYNGKWSNYVEKYAMPIANVFGATVVAGNKTMVINNQHREPTTGARYMLCDADTEKEIAYKVGTKSNTTWTYSQLTNGKLYYVVAVPYRDYKGQRLWGPNQMRIYFLPMGIPGNGKVNFTNNTTAEISIGNDSAVDGIRVLYRTIGGALKNGCEAKGAKCTISSLNKNTAYEFYAMKYKMAQGKKYYSMGTLIPYKTALSGLKAPQNNPVVTMTNSGYTTFSIKKTAEADGISVLYREGEGAFQQACEKAGNSCSTTLSTTKNYTFYIMQYKVVSGKKLYSNGIVARDFSSGKSADTERLYTNFYLADESISQEEIAAALDDYLTEDAMLMAEAMEAMSEELMAKSAEEYNYEFIEDDDSWIEEYARFDSDVMAEMIEKQAVPEPQPKEEKGPFSWLNFFFLGGDDNNREAPVPSFENK